MKQIGRYWKIQGKVQGVWYRVSAKQEADRLGLKGIVSNHQDGSVCIWVYGEEERIDQFKNWCKHGPPMAEVLKLTEKLILFEELAEFTIRR